MPNGDMVTFKYEIFQQVILLMIACVLTLQYVHTDQYMLDLHHKMLEILVFFSCIPRVLMTNSMSMLFKKFPVTDFQSILESEDVTTEVRIPQYTVNHLRSFLSSCHPAIWSSGHLVILSSSHPVIKSSSHLVIKQVIQSSSHQVIKSYSH